MISKERAIVELRAEFKKALGLIIGNKKSEYEIQCLLQLFRDFNAGRKVLKPSEKAEFGPGFHINVEARGTKRRRDQPTDPDVTQAIDEKDLRK